ncbi:MAG: hypothetical protein NZ942_00835 [Candidatus Aenigmarchaeota archaeon]|nr:hypothetical protein [Candidatus Aenigmarchaeota archaeon]
MQRNEKLLLLLGLFNFLFFVQGLALKIPEQTPELLLIIGMEIFTPLEVLVQLIVFFFLFTLPGFIFTITFFKEFTKLEKTFLSFTISSLLFGIFDSFGAGILGPVNYYSIASTSSLVFIIVFSLLGIFLYNLKKIGVSGRVFNTVFVVFSLFFFFIPLIILKNIPFEILLNFEKSIPWWFNPPCVCSEVNFLVSVGSLMIVFFLLSFVFKLKKEFLMIPLLLLLGFLLFSLSKFIDTYHGILSFSIPTFLVWIEDLANKSEILMSASLLLLLILNLELFRVVRKI